MGNLEISIITRSASEETTQFVLAHASGCQDKYDPQRTAAGNHRYFSTAATNSSQSRAAAGVVPASGTAICTPIACGL